MRLHIQLAHAVIAGLLLLTFPAVSQASESFFPQASNNLISVTKGGMLQRTISTPSDEWMLPISAGEIRTVDPSPGDQGRVYGLNGVVIGGSITNMLVGTYYECTTDRVSSFIINYGGGGEVYRCDLDV